jgi:hypothetical protein
MNNSTSLTPLWSDRARFWGLPIIFEWYKIFHDKLEVRRGVLFQQTDMLPLYRIVDVKSERSLIDMICGTGKILIFSVDGTDPRQILKGIRSPQETAEMILDAAEQMKATLGVRGGEIYGAAFAESRMHP